MTDKETSTPSEPGIRAIRQTAGALIRPDILSVRVTGEDRVRFLNGMLSTNVAQLGLGQAQASLKASAKGRVEGLVRVRFADDALILDLNEATAGQVAGELVKFVVMDDVALTDISDEREVVFILGPRAKDILEKTGWSKVPTEDFTTVSAPNGTLIRNDSYGVEGYELHLPKGSSSGLDALVGAGAHKISETELNVVRIEAGLPKDGVDITADTIPLEARLDSAIDLNKGCFIGQEVIARATHRGGVKHKLIGLKFSSSGVVAGAELWPSGSERARGHVTSTVYSPSLGREIGLGFVHVDFQTPGTQLEVRWPTGQCSAEVVELPHIS